jgi:hypothetical protein
MLLVSNPTAASIDPTSPLNPFQFLNAIYWYDASDLTQNRPISLIY